MKRPWLAWLIFALCAGAMLAIMAWGSRELLQLDAREKASRQEAELEENVRLSLWRMDTSLAPMVLQENSRPYTGYLTQSPNHFEIDDSGKTASRLAGLKEPTARAALQAAVPKTWLLVAKTEPPAIPAPPSESPSPPANNTATAAALVVQTLPSVTFRDPFSQGGRNAQEFQVRNSQFGPGAPGPSQQMQTVPRPQPPPTSKLPSVPPPPPPIEVRTGAMTPIWVGDDLLLARHVQVGAKTMLQCVRMDWQQQRTTLLANIQDLLPNANLIPERGPFDPSEGRTLTSLPLRLVPGKLPVTAAAETSPILFSLKLAWTGMAIAILAVGLLLMGAISLSQRRSAFVSSVTHELRTPLTTFRMYTEMLVEGMASDPAKQSQYHQILYRESDRLMHLVENVLSYARLEKGRYGHSESVSLNSLLERPMDRLAEHARLAGMLLEVSIAPDAAEKIVRADASAIERILFNLVDNACKYAGQAGAGGFAREDKRIHIEVDCDARHARIAVRDHGPGIEPHRIKRLFRPFKKTVHEAAKSAPGIGIGLHLSRRLARAAGGRLLVLGSDQGACLRLELPLA